MLSVKMMLIVSSSVKLLRLMKLDMELLTKTCY